MKSIHLVTALASALSLFGAMPALAHPALVASDPAAAATAIKVKAVTLTFSEPIMPQVSGLEIVMTGMPGMAGHHPAMKVAGVKTVPGVDHKSLVATLPRPLVAGTYEVRWHAAGHDGHGVSGSVTFTAR